MEKDDAHDAINSGGVVGCHQFVGILVVSLPPSRGRLEKCGADHVGRWIEATTLLQDAI